MSTVRTRIPRSAPPAQVVEHTPARRPAKVALQVRSILGPSAGARVFAESVFVTQPDTDTDAITINSAGAAYGSGLLVINDSTGAHMWAVANSGILTTTQAIIWSGAGNWQVSPLGWSQGSAIATPATPPATFGRFYIKAKGATTGMYFLDDAGAEHDLAGAPGSAGVPGPTYLSLSKWGLD